MRPLPALLLALLGATLAAQTSGDAQRVARVASLGRLWGYVQFQHPWLANESQVWEDAFAVEAAKVWEHPTPEVYRTAVANLLGSLKDPATRISEPPAPSSVELPASLQPYEKTKDGILLVHFNDPGRFWSDPAKADAALRPAIAESRAVIFDLRPAKNLSEKSNTFSAQDVLDRLLPSLLREPLPLPGRKTRLAMGYPTPSRPTYWYSAYTTGVFIQQGWIAGPENRIQPRIIFVANQATDLPFQALALQHQGLAWVVFEGDAPQDWTAEVDKTPLLDDLKVEVRLAECVFPDGSSGAGPDARTPASAYVDSKAPALRKAMELAVQADLPAANHVWPGPRVPLLQSARKPDRDPMFPDLGHRLLSAVKLWRIIDTFFAYRDLLDQPWNPMLEAQLAEYARASSALQYQEVVARNLAGIHDSHGLLGAQDPTRAPIALDCRLGEALPSCLVQVVEGKVAVTSLWGDSAQASGLKAGDVVLKVDGEAIRARMDRIRPFLAASTDQRLEFKTANRALGGPPDRDAVLEVDGGNGVHLVTIKRDCSLDSRPVRGSGPTFRILPGNLGFVDLGRLKAPEAAMAYEALQHTVGVIFDMRGYPNPESWKMPGLFNAHAGVTAARFRTPMLFGGDDSSRVALESTQETEGVGKPPYPGKVAMLVDEYSQSSAEHLGLHLEAGNHAIFVGSPTSGANGNVAFVELPGGLSARFTGLDTRHGDGRQLQRKGLQPHLPVRPSLIGLRAGRDEVLERAVEWMEKGH